jgi:hypothetical protein
MAILYTLPTQYNQYENCVLERKVDQSYRIMSDIWGTADYAYVWDEATASPKMVLVNVYDMNPSDWKPTRIEVDATDEVRAKFLNWRTKIEFETLLGTEEQRVRQIEKGAVAKVVKGKNGKGTIGPVVVAMNAIYGMGWRSSQELKVAIATSDVKVKKALRNGKVAEVYQDVVWAWARNVVRVDIAKIDREALQKQALERAVRFCRAA